jgi:hypothetical protein
MELREMIIALAGMSIGLGIGLMVYAVHRIRETRHARWFRKSDKRYKNLIEKINKSETAMRSHVDELTALKDGYSNVA